MVWCMGITYMLAVTLTVLQLREVLHPGNALVAPVKGLGQTSHYVPEPR